MVRKNRIRSTISSEADLYPNLAWLPFLTFGPWTDTCRLNPAIVTHNRRRQSFIIKPPGGDDVSRRKLLRLNNLQLIFS